MLKDVLAAHQVELSIKNLSNAQFDVLRETVMTANPETRTVESNISQCVLFTRQDHLNEILEGQATIFIRVKELNQTIALALGCHQVAMISYKVQEFKRGDKPVLISVDSLEGRVRSEVAYLAETLTTALELTLAISHGY
jgi:hypothetical protein